MRGSETQPIKLSKLLALDGSQIFRSRVFSFVAPVVLPIMERVDIP